MNSLFRGWFGDSADPQGGAWSEVRDWATSAGHRFAIGRGGEGFVVEADSGGPEFRIEWGPSQRNYITGQELRVRVDVGQAGGVQMLAATRVVIDHLEHEVFKQFTEGNETRMDDETPEEMRWVVMYPQVPGNLLGGLRTRFALLSNRPRASTLWLEHGLSGPLQASASWHESAVPMVLVVQRGRFVLRMALPEPRVAVLEGGLSLGLAAAAAARHVIAEVARGTDNSQRPSIWDPLPDPTAHEVHVQDNA
jgi:hypothetical protein